MWSDLAKSKCRHLKFITLLFVNFVFTLRTAERLRLLLKAKDGHMIMSTLVHSAHLTKRCTVIVDKNVSGQIVFFFADP